MTNPNLFQVRVEEIKHTPRDYKALQLLVEIACFVGEWHSGCKAFVRSQISKLPWEWATEVEHQISEAEANQHQDKGAAISDKGDDVVSELKNKQGIYYAYGVLCFVGSSLLSPVDVARLCEFQVLAHSRTLFPQNKVVQEQQEYLNVQRLNVMAGRSREIMQHAQHDSTFITKAVANILECTPSQLTWTHLASTAGCFEAESGGHLYSVNLLSGTVLFDGSPPGLLTEEIVSDASFTRTFGSSNFETIKSSDGVYTTTKAVNCRIYGFSLRGSTRSELVIEEIDQESGVRLELLRHDGQWAKDFPHRVRNLHSHWLYREQGVIIVRPKHFLQREVDYIGRCNGTCAPASIFRVPCHRRKDGWTKLLDEIVGTEKSGVRLFDKVVRVDEGHPVASTLAKFERLSEILVFQTTEDGLLFELPRFHLHFLIPSTPLQEGLGKSGVQCLDYGGYELASNQQLSGSLAEYTRYLVLQGETTRIIVPVGRVMVREGMMPLVTVECPREDTSDTHQDVYCYEVHHRWKGLQANGISSRLQLAALFAASGTLLPEKQSNMTGSEKAIELVRRCAVNQPLQGEDRSQLVRIVELSHHNPALAIICGHVLKSSQALQSIYRPGGALNLVDTAPSDLLLGDAATAYEGECASREWNRRRRLKPTEENQTLGSRSSRIRKPLPGGRTIPTYGTLVLAPSPIGASDVAEAELALWPVSRGPTPSAVTSTTRPPYPLILPSRESRLSAEMHAELRESWNAHHHLSQKPNFFDPDGQLRETFAAKHGEVTCMRQAIEAFLLDGLVNFGGDWHARSWHLQRVAALLPTASLEDFPAMILEKGRIQEWNPFLSEASSIQIREGIISWLRLCVLEDKLERLERYVGTTGSQSLLRRELQVSVKSGIS